jgi:glucosamine-6-phosphate deaminase
MQPLHTEQNGSIKIEIYRTVDEVAEAAANIYNSVLNSNPESVLGFATGSTPIPIYSKLTESCKKGTISFSRVTSFNLDEYWRLPGDNKESYRYFMDKYLFNGIDIKPYNTNVLNGMAKYHKFECLAFEDKITSVGGIDMWLLGIGRNGHIAFNEPGSSVDSRTRLVSLSPTTVQAMKDANFGNGTMNFPNLALTVGVGTIMEARKIVLVATGNSKAEAIEKALNGDVCQSMPASYLKGHHDVTFLLDVDAAKNYHPF